MAKKSLSISCTNCLTDYSIQAREVESVSFCAFCGEPLQIIVDELEDDETDWDEDDD